jgi:hypothetical protein
LIVVDPSGITTVRFKPHYKHLVSEIDSARHFDFARKTWMHYEIGGLDAKEKLAAAKKRKKWIA